MARSFLRGGIARLLELRSRVLGIRVDAGRLVAVLLRLGVREGAIPLGTERAFHHLHDRQVAVARAAVFMLRVGIAPRGCDVRTQIALLACDLDEVNVVAGHAVLLSCAGASNADALLCL